MTTTVSQTWLSVVNCGHSNELMQHNVLYVRYTHRGIYRFVTRHDSRSWECWHVGWHQMTRHVRRSRFKCTLAIPVSSIYTCRSGITHLSIRISAHIGIVIVHSGGAAASTLRAYRSTERFTYATCDTNTMTIHRQKTALYANSISQRGYSSTATTAITSTTIIIAQLQQSYETQTQ